MSPFQGTDRKEASGYDPFKTPRFRTAISQPASDASDHQTRWKESRRATISNPGTWPLRIPSGLDILVTREHRHDGCIALTTENRGKRRESRPAEGMQAWAEPILERGWICGAGPRFRQEPGGLPRLPGSADIEGGERHGRKPVMKTLESHCQSCRALPSPSWIPKPFQDLEPSGQKLSMVGCLRHRRPRATLVGQDGWAR